MARAPRAGRRCDQHTPGFALRPSCHRSTARVADHAGCRLQRGAPPPDAPGTAENRPHRRSDRPGPAHAAVSIRRLGTRIPVRRKGGISAERASMNVTAWMAVAVFAACCVLIATEWVHRAAAPGGGTPRGRGALRRPGGAPGAWRAVPADDAVAGPGDRLSPGVAGPRPDRDRAAGCAADAPGPSASRGARGAVSARRVDAPRHRRSAALHGGPPSTMIVTAVTGTVTVAAAYVWLRLFVLV